MTKTNIAALLEKYNRDLYAQNDTRENTNVSADDARLGSASYADPRDYMLDKYSTDRNFSADMYQQAQKLGEQDTYLSLVAHNAGKTMSDQFYDPQYASYESIMLELYKGVADNTEPVDQVIDEFDPVSGEWVQKDLGKMTERERIQYDLNLAYEARTAEITKQLEQQRKDSMSFFEHLGSGAAVVGMEFAEGTTSALAGLVDLFGGLTYATAAGVSGENFLDAFVEYYGEYGLLAANKENFRAAIDEYERKYTIFRDIDGNITSAGKYVAGIANSLGMMLPSILLTVPTGGTSWLGSATFYASIFSGNVYDNATRAETVESPSWLKITNAFATAGAEYVIEWALGKILGGTIQNSLIGLGGRGLPGGIKELSKLNGFKYMLKSAGQEGLEEFLQDYGTHCINAFTTLWHEGYGKDGVSFQTLVDAFIAGFLSSIVLTGGAIGKNKIASVSRNLKGRKEGTYKPGDKFGPGDMVIETAPGEYKKVGGLTRLYYSSVLSDFREAVKTLEKNRGKNKDVALAAQVYAGMNELAQFYASFDKQRLENCQRLLERVTAIESELLGTESAPAGTIESDIDTEIDTWFEDARAGRKERKTVEKERVKALKKYASEVSNTLDDLLLSPHVAKQTRAALARLAEMLSDGGVKEVTGVADKDGKRKRRSRKRLLDTYTDFVKTTTLTEDEETEEGESALSPAAEAKIDTILRESEYSRVFTTDGHIAAGDGDILFVPESWLENYSLPEIYKFLVQADVLNALATKKELAPIVEKVWEFAEKFTGKTLDWEDALMNLFFNENMYQAFLLSNGGENLHAFKELLVTLPLTIKKLAETYADTPVKKNQLDAIFGLMKATMRIPTIKAILNWNFVPQEIMADVILEPQDLEFIQQEKGRRATLAKGSGGAYQRLAKDLLKIGKFNDEEKALITRVLKDPDKASDRERLVVQAMLDEADRRHTTIAPLSLNIRISNNMIDVCRPIFNFLRLSEDDIKAARTDEFFATDPEADAKTAFLAGLRKLEGVYSDVVLIELDENLRDEYYGLGIDLNDFLEVGIDQPISNYADIAQRLFDFSQKLRGASSLYATRLRPGLGTGAFTVDPRAFFNGAEKTEEIQHIDDVLKAFTKLYGIPADQMYVRTLDGITKDNFDKLQADMTAMGVDDYQVYVVRKLEQMLGDDYVVTPAYEQEYYNVEPFSFVDRKVADRFWERYRDLLSLSEMLQRDFDMTGPNAGSTKTHDLVEGFLDILTELSAPSDKYHERPTLSEELSKKLDSVWHSLNTKNDLYIRRWVLANWKTFDDIRLQIMNELEISVFGPEPIDNYVTEFKIAKKIPADRLLISELLEDDLEERNGRFVDLFESESKTLSVSDFVTSDIDKKVLRKLMTWRVELNSQGNGTAAAVTYPEQRKIVIFTNVSGDYVHSFAHEVNHVLQEIENLPHGGDAGTLKGNHPVLKHTLDNYPEYVEYVARRVDNTIFASKINAGRHSGRKKSIDLAQLLETASGVYRREIIDVLSYCAYRLISGEMWAEHYDHNGRPVRGYSRVVENGTEYLVTPDGKERFEWGAWQVLRMSAQASDAKISPELAGQALVNSLLNVVEATKAADATSYRESVEIRNTYHAALTRGSAWAILVETGVLTDDFLKYISYGRPITIDNVIKNPEAYLSEDFISDMAEWGRGLSEGDVYFYLKEWIEEHKPGISIDRSSKHEYILVDDNAYDDLLTVKSKRLADGEGHFFVEQFLGKEATLGDFYDAAKLRTLGVSAELPVVIRSDVTSQFVVNSTHPQGVIYINASDTTRDVRLIDTLNHEFRHLMQRYNALEGGFTLNFVVTDEIVADIEKHAPALFANERIKMWGQRAAGKDWKRFIARQAIYRLTGGELNAFGINASLLSTKTIYVNYEAGKPTIFMPWYNANTGEGRHKTDALSYREDTEVPPLPPSDGSDTKRKGRKRKFTGERFKDRTGEPGPGFDLPIDSPVLEEGARARYVSKKRAEGTNLEFYTKDLKPGEQAEIDPRIQDFVLAADLSRLDPVLRHAIEHRKLNMQTLKGWLINEKVDLAEIDDYTFRLLAKHVFKNEYFKTGKELQRFLDNVQTGVWWAAGIVFRGGLQNDGQVDRVSIETMLTQNKLETFLAFYNSLEGSRWKKAIDEKAKDFTIFKDIVTRQKVAAAPSAAVQRGARIYALQYFNGSLAGAFHVANTFRNAIELYENEVGNITSIDRSTKNAKGEENKGTIADQVTEKNRIQSNSLVTDLVALYEEEVAIDLDEDEIRRMQTELVLARIKQEGWDIENAKDKEKMTTWASEVMSLDTAGLVSLYAAYDEGETLNIVREETGVDTVAPSFEYDPYRNRVNIVGRIKRAGNKLAKLVNEGQFPWSNLPNEVKELFDVKELEVVNPNVKSKSKKKKPNVRKEYTLKKSTYSVGPGKAALSTEVDPNIATYSPKKDIREGNDRYKHDVTELLRNEQLLKNTLAVIKNRKAVEAGGDPAVARDTRGTIRNVEFKLTEKINVRVDDPDVHKTTVAVRKRRTTHTRSDTPNHFTIVSNVEMPEVLQRILDVSFNEMADTRVQWASKDDEGNLYDKDSKGFKSRLQHEITNWEAFYEANRESLINLTRSDVLSIVDFFQNGVATTNGPASKLGAFEIFLLGYIVDAARHDSIGWHFSAAEIELVEKIYEAKASAFGSGLNAVKQMVEVINPLKKIQEGYFELYNILPGETDLLVAAIKGLEQATTKKDREAALTKLNDEIKALEILIEERREKGAFKRFGEKIKTWRYTSMLSSPATWVRNWASNVTTGWLIKSSNWIGDLLPKKGYRDNQWNLNGVRVTEDVRNFIDAFFRSDIFDPLYEHSSKYDDAAKTRKRTNTQTLLVQMISSALEKKFAAEHHWDSKIANRVTEFIQKRISDKRFVKKATEKYFGKMLTIAIEKGEANIDKGLQSKGVLELFSEAIILANDDYMHRRNFLSDMFDGIRLTHPYAYQALMLWQPFASAGWNWFVESLKYSPFGLAASIIRLHKLENAITKAETLREKGRPVPHSRFTQYLIRRDIGKGIVGGILWALGAWLAVSGVLRITEDDDDTFYMTIGDVKLDISEIFGSSSLLVGASIVQTFVEQADGAQKNWDDVFNIFSEHLLGGFILNELLERHRWDQNAGEHLTVELESFAKSYVPQFWQLFVRVTSNAKIKYSPGVLGAFERLANALIPTMPAGNLRVNPYTGEMETKYAIPIAGELLKSGIFTGGVKILYSEVSDGEILAKEYDVNKNPLTGEITIDDKKVRISDTIALNQKYGEMNAADLAKIKSQKHRVEMPNGKYKTLSWDEMSDKQRANVIERTFTANANIAKVYMWTQKMNHKYYASASVYQELKALGITKNVFRGDKGFVE